MVPDNTTNKEGSKGKSVTKYLFSVYSLAAVVRRVAAVEAVAAAAGGLQVWVEHGAAAPRPHHHTDTWPPDTDMLS